MAGRRLATFVVALLVGAAMAVTVPASAADTVVSLRFLDKDGQALSSGIVQAWVCPPGSSPPAAACQRYDVPAGGLIQQLVDTSLSYNVFWSAYTHFGGVTSFQGSTTQEEVFWLPGVGQPRSFTGSVALNGFLVGAGQGGSFACPISLVAGCVAPGGNGTPGLITLVDAAGNFSTTLNGAATYNLRGFAFESGQFVVTNPPNQHGPATTAIHHDYEIWTPGTTFAGRLERSGYETADGGFQFPPGVAGVGACPEGLPYGHGCIPRFVYADADGDFALRLPPGDWAAAGFIFIDGVPVIGTDVRHLTVVDRGNGPPETSSLAVVSADVNATTESVTSVSAGEGGGDLVVQTTGEGLSNVVSVPNDASHTPPPAALSIPFGLLSVTSAVPAGQSSVTFTITFDTPLASGAQWYKLRNGVWMPYPATISPDRLSIQFTIEDGGPGDDDGAVNGSVTDPGFVGVPDFTGFLDPILPSNEMRAGRTVPVQWRLLVDAVPVTDPAHLEALTTRPCSGGAATAVASKLKYLGDGYWQVNWKTPGARGACIVLTLDVRGHDPVEATFNLR